MILSGHSHTTFIGEVDGIKIFNVGSVGNPCDGDDRLSYGILRFADGNLELEIKRVEYPIEECKTF